MKISSQSKGNNTLSHARRFQFTWFNKIFVFFSIILSLLILLSQYKVAGLLFSILIIGGIMYSIFLTKNPLHMIGWMVGFTPYVTLLRPFIISYSGFTFLLLFMTLLMFLISKQKFIKVISNKKLLLFLILYITYVFVGILQDTSPVMLMKYLEFLAGIILVSILFLDKKLLTQSLVNLMFGILLYWVAIITTMLNRFQIDTIYGFEISSDPSGSAGFLILGLIILLFDRGRLVNMQNTKLRFILIIGMLFFLVMSTSRTNFIIFLLLLLIFTFRYQKSVMKYILMILPILFVLYISLGQDYQSQLEKMYIEKLFSEERSLNQVTTGRLDQYIISYQHIINTSWDKRLFGVGVGDRSFYNEALQTYGIKLGLESAYLGRAYVLHSMYLILTVELGLLALVYFLLVMFMKLYENYLLYKRSMIIPFYFTVSYMVNIFSNQGIGTLGALFIAFIFYGKYIYLSDREH